MSIMSSKRTLIDFWYNQQKMIKAILLLALLAISRSDYVISTNTLNLTFTSTSLNLDELDQNTMTDINVGLALITASLVFENTPILTAAIRRNYEDGQLEYSLFLDSQQNQHYQAIIALENNQSVYRLVSVAELVNNTSVYFTNPYGVNVRKPTPDSRLSDVIISIADQYARDYKKLSQSEIDSDVNIPKFDSLVKNDFPDHSGETVAVYTLPQGMSTSYIIFKSSGKSKSFNLWLIAGVISNINHQLYIIGINDVLSNADIIAP